MVECCTMFSLYQSSASTFPIKLLHCGKVPWFLQAALHLAQTSPCLTAQGIHTQQTSDSSSGPVPWQCPSTENRADSPVLRKWNKLSKIKKGQFMRLFSSLSSVSWFMLWQDSIYIHDNIKISGIFFISKLLLFSNLTFSSPHYF